MSLAGIVNPYLERVRPIKDLAEYVKVEGEVAEINARDLTHKEVNDLIRECVIRGARKIILRNVFGQRFIGTRLALNGIKVEIEIHGIPGNDLGAFLAGHRIVVYGNAQDGVGNTMDSGEIIVHGRAGDVVAMSMRGGEIYIRDTVGYRAAIHMKGYMERNPVLVIGKTAQDFLGEYMAGGRVIVLGIGVDRHKARYIGTGMHGGKIFIRGKVEEYQLAKEVTFGELDKEDWKFLEEKVGKFCEYFNCDKDELLGDNFTAIIPKSKRPYGALYSGE
ncbi:hypothetical protein A3L04_02555 [Thermococcus chitonophagus]|uniref:Glutamate synthase, alpha subunit domain protein n=1 Tax=Thermococcus chitonophagus TaxID=54262 RepID=A0A170SDW3_9EURY|nr:hypothetical protein [Thermococcus chitonophagus]ASJ16037.1 hypothetical protein A3L04_02555 [Thermococcus chitonophagus]CUX77284.1 Glutamate synthase, alpha subunit domain protein [Thermococcus chitonophagus]